MKEFWKEHPALFVGLSILAGVSAPLFHMWPLALCWFTYTCFYSVLAARLVFLAAAYSLLLNPPREPNLTPQQTKGTFQIERRLPPSQFSKQPLYLGTFDHLPCLARIPGKPPLDHELFVHGTLLEKEPYHLFLKVQSWETLPERHPLVAFRESAKRSFKGYLRRHISDRECAAFLSSLCTGEVEGRWLRFLFGRLGLQHLLAVSGFHFGLLIAFLAFLFRPLPARLTSLLLLTAATLYFLFLGSNPAVFRTWLMLSFYLIAQLLQRNTSPLNLLGAALTIELLLDPLIASNIAFQLTFASCLGLFLITPEINELLLPVLPEPSLTSHPLALLGGPLRRSISASLAVTIALLPLLLFHFHRFPFLSLLYNLLIPPLVALALFLLLLSFLIPPLFPLTTWVTRELLDLVTHPPLVLDYGLSLPIPSLLPPLLLFLLFLKSRTSATILPITHGGRSSVG